MATTFLFWNVNKKPLASIVTQLALEHDVDVIILVENTIQPRHILEQLNNATIQYHFTFSGFENIAIYTRFDPKFLRVVLEARGLSIRRLELPGQIDITVVAVHFPSKLQWSNDSQAIECLILADRIRSVEEQVGHSRTVIIGDLNMNPFELEWSVQQGCKLL